MKIIVKSFSQFSLMYFWFWGSVERVSWVYGSELVNGGEQGFDLGGGRTISSITKLYQINKSVSKSVC